MIYPLKIVIFHCKPCWNMLESKYMEVHTFLAQLRPALWPFSTTAGLSLTNLANVLESGWIMFFSHLWNDEFCHEPVYVGDRCNLRCSLSHPFLFTTIISVANCKPLITASVPHQNQNETNNVEPGLINLGCLIGGV